MPNIVAEPITITLTGATSTALTCASTTGLYVGQRGWAVKSDTTGNVEVVVSNIISATQFLCQLVSAINNSGGVDLTDYEDGKIYFGTQDVEVPGGDTVTAAQKAWLNTATACPVFATGEEHTVDELITTLQGLGICKQE